MDVLKEVVLKKSLERKNYSEQKYGKIKKFVMKEEDLHANSIKQQMDVEEKTVA